MKECSYCGKVVKTTIPVEALVNGIQIIKQACSECDGSVKTIGIKDFTAKELSEKYGVPMHCFNRTAQSFIDEALEQIDKEAKLFRNEEEFNLHIIHAIDESIRDFKCSGNEPTLILLGKNFRHVFDKLNNEFFKNGAASYEEFTYKGLMVINLNYDTTNGYEVR